MEKWEYRTEIIFANIDNKKVKQYIAQKYPSWKNPPKFTPETLEFHLNELGENGWEVIHMQPVAGMGNNGDVQHNATGIYSNAYFCILKRRDE